jgi:putative DNA primase/helicase
VRAATDSYLSSVDALGTWLDECCVQAPDAWATREALFSSWSKWAVGAGERPGSKAEFLNKLRNRFDETGRDGRRGFRGVQLKPVDERAYVRWRSSPSGTGEGGSSRCIHANSAVAAPV